MAFIRSFINGTLSIFSSVPLFSGTGITLVFCWAPTGLNHSIAQNNNAQILNVGFTTDIFSPWHNPSLLGFCAWLNKNVRFILQFFNRTLRELYLRFLRTACFYLFCLGVSFGKNYVLK
ncbi:MAG: hypothetical protein K2I87_02700 [Bacteroidales bacterium]|nr:hypothetical protein [Bacteroidales bacterium]